VHADLEHLAALEKSRVRIGGSFLESPRSVNPEIEYEKDLAKRMSTGS
jgi:hypothetical protein